jgi:Mg-chelatase subunit ChlD
MAQVFVSFVQEDAGLAEAIARGLEEAGLRAWYYTRDNNKPGPWYLAEITAAIEACEAVVVVISHDTIGSHQVSSEIVQAFEEKKPLIPVLRGLTHVEFQKLQPAWRGPFGAATSIEIPPAGPAAILPRLLGGLFRLGLAPRFVAPRPAPAPVPPPQAPEARPQPAPPPTPTPPAEPAARVELTATFDRDAYPAGEDPLAYWLAELRVTSGGEVADEGDGGPGADLALVLDVSGSMNRPDRYPLLCQAVRRLVGGLRSQDRMSVTLFSSRSATVVPFTPGDAAARDPEAIIRAMNNSGLLFENTMLAPGLRLALDGFGRGEAVDGRVRRAYILTDGELHDTPACEDALTGFRPRLAEVHVYGFGSGFNATALKQLVSDQIGGTVKPILNEEDIIKTFAHVAAVNRRLVGQNGKLTITFAPDVVCGDAWVFKPGPRYLGPVRGQRVEHVFGGIEAERPYSLLLEVRLPSAVGPVGVVEAEWIAKDERVAHRLEVAARRGPDGRLDEGVRRALDILHALRAGEDKAAQLAAYKARRELAEIEGRDPNLIAALDKAIAELTRGTRGTASEGNVRATLTEDDLRYLDADQITWSSTDIDDTLLRELRPLTEDPNLSPDAKAAAAAQILGDHVRSGAISSTAAAVLAEVVRQGTINGQTIQYIRGRYRHQ